MSNVTTDYYKEKITVTYLLAIIFALIVLDVALDVIEGLPMKELAYDLLLEGIIMAVVLHTARFIWKKFVVTKEKKEAIKTDLEKTKALASAWERKSKQFIQEFQAHLSQKFEDWDLSKSEKEISLLLLQGKSSKEIAAFRFTSERTIRNQCRSIYEKSGLSGKNEFSAYFLNEMIADFSV